MLIDGRKSYSKGKNRALPNFVLMRQLQKNMELNLKKNFNLFLNYTNKRKKSSLNLDFFNFIVPTNVANFIHKLAEVWTTRPFITPLQEV